MKTVYILEFRRRQIFFGGRWGSRQKLFCLMNEKRSRRQQRSGVPSGASVRLGSPRRPGRRPSDPQPYPPRISSKTIRTSSVIGLGKTACVRYVPRISIRINYRTDGNTRRRIYYVTLRFRPVCDKPDLTALHIVHIGRRISSYEFVLL